METGHQILQKNKRLERAKDVQLKRVSEQTYNVIDEDGNLKYVVCVTPGAEDCTCPNFVHQNTKEYADEHGTFFECKHLLKAKQEEVVNS